MTLEDVLAATKDAMTVRRVFAEPHTQDGTTVVAAAKVLGGGGGGGGRDQQGQKGEGGGVRADRSSGRGIRDQGRHGALGSAVDVNRAILVAGAIALVALRRRWGAVRT